MAFICSSASAIGKCLVGSIPREIGYILSYENNLKELEANLQRLKYTEASVKLSVDEAEMNAEEIEHIVHNWLMKADEIVYKAYRLIEIEEDRWCLGQCPNLWTRNRLSRIFEEMTWEISQVMADGKFDRISYRIPFEVTLTPFSRGYETLDSRTSVLNEIKQALKDPKMYMIGVHGMGGVGKTALVNELAWQVRKDGSFDVVVIATISASPYVEKIQDQIAETLLGQKLEKTTKVGRAGELRQRIRHEKSVLVILDDIWSSSELDLTEVGIPFGDEHNGCKLVVTSRDRNVLIKMGTQKDFDLRALMEEDSWILFKKMAGDVVEEFNIKPIAKEVAKCCAGLPLLIVTVAKGLRKKDVTTWKDAQTQLERFLHEELQKKVYPTLELSYDCLDTEELKSLFLFIGSFGLNKISTGELFLCCWGLGFYGHMQTLTKARNRHYKLINDLRASSLLLEADGEPEWVKMDDVMSDVAKSIASRFHPTYAVQRKTKLEEWPSVDQLKICHYIIVPSSYIGELPEKLECPELKLLVLENIGDHYLKVPYNFFSRMKEVRVLILHGMVFIPSPSTSLNLLINLRLLSLCRCSLEDISMVAKLTNLEILSLEDSSIEEPIPTHSFENLKVIKVKGCSGLRNLLLYSLVRNLSQLQEMDISFCRDMEKIIAIEKQENEEELPMIVLPELHSLTLKELPMLLSFHLPLTDDKGNPSIQSIPLALFNEQVVMPKLETLKLYHINTCKIWDDKLGVVSCFQNLTCLEVVGFHRLTSLFSSWVGRALIKLQHLHISKCSMLKEIFVPEEKVQFPNLETLDISHMSGLRSIWPNEVAPNSFCKLWKISIDLCESLDYVFPISVAKELWQLKDLEITRCAIKNIVEKSDSNDITLVYLEKLRVIECHNMKTIVPSSVLFHTLDELDVCRCDGVVNIITPSTITCLPKLRILKVTGCPELEEIYGSSNEGDAPLALGEIAFMKLEELTLSDLSRLISFCQGSYDFYFQSLQMVELHECPMMQTFSHGNLTTPSYTKVQYV